MPKGPSAPRKPLMIEKKLNRLKKLDEGWSVMRVCDHFGVKKQTVSDIKKKKYSTGICCEIQRSFLAGVEYCG